MHSVCSLALARSRRGGGSNLKVSASGVLFSCVFISLRAGFPERARYRWLSTRNRRQPLTSGTIPTDAKSRADRRTRRLLDERTRLSTTSSKESGNPKNEYSLRAKLRLSSRPLRARPPRMRAASSSLSAEGIVCRYRYPATPETILL